MAMLRDDLRLALDRVAFAEELGMIPDPWQRDLLRSDSKRVLINAARQSGKSTCTAIIALHRALYRPGSLVLVLAPAERQSKELFAKVASFYRALGEAVPADSARKLGMELPNRSRIEALPGSEKTVRGFSGVDLLILDEASRIEDALYFAAKPMLAVSAGRIVGLSTPWGKRGWWFEEWISGSSAGWERYKIPATECPRISPAFLAEERAALPTRIFKQEYCCEFVEREDSVFTYSEIESAMSDEIEPLFGSTFSREAS